MTADLNFWDGLNTEEADFAARIIDELSPQPWAQPLINKIAGSGGITTENKSLLFELRFGYALHQVGITPQYEIPGEEGSTIDFGFVSQEQEWAVEMMRLEETTAVREATQFFTDNDSVQWSRQALSTNAEDPRQSPEGETLKAIERICQKCEKDGHPHKFPAADTTTYHVILVDFRTYAFGGDEYDRMHIAIGGEYVPAPYRHYWNGQLISGVFHPNTTLKGAEQARERLHFIGFVNETKYEPGGFGRALSFIANPHIFDTKEKVEKARNALGNWPIP